MLDREFDSAALAGLREAVLGCAVACGMPEDQAIDVMLAVHELAANAVCHGPGRGRLRINVTASTLRCEVSDTGPSSRGAGRAPAANSLLMPTQCPGRSSKATACGWLTRSPTTSALPPGRTGR